MLALSSSTLIPDFIVATSQARHGSAGVCAVLVEHDVDVNVGNSLGTRPLATACRYGHLEVVEWLLAAPSVRVDAADDAGFTALHEVRGQHTLRGRGCCFVSASA